MRSLRLAILGLCLSATLLAVETPPDIPDPYGLGPRLALLDHLKEKYHLKPAKDATYEQLVAMYWQAERKSHPPEQARLDDSTAGGDDTALARDRIERLRAAVRKELGSDPSPEASEDELSAMLRERREQRSQEAARVGAERAERERLSERSEPAASAKRKADPAAAEPAAGAAASWTDPVRNAWAALSAIPVDVPTEWPVQVAEMANFANAYRFRPRGGEFAYDDQPPAYAEGLEVWIQNTRIESGRGGFGGFQTSRWVPAAWIAEDKTWTIEHPARYRWARESLGYAVLVRSLIAGPKSDRERLAAWSARRKALKASEDEAPPDPGQDADFAGLCHAAAKEGGFRDKLLEIEGLAMAIEFRFARLDRGIAQLTVATDLARGAPEDTTAAERQAGILARLEAQSKELLDLHRQRRELLEGVVADLAGGRR